MRSSAKSSVLALLVLAITCMPALADDAKVQAGVQAATTWLEYVDSGDYPMSWLEAAPLFQGLVPLEGWVSTLEGVRTPLGGLVHRDLASAEYATTLPGAPDGEYVVLIFNTGFDNKRSAEETVTVMLDSKGVWRAAGYYIK